MDNHKPVSDRIRPILQAMERSIDSARRTRVKEPSAPLAAPLAQAGDGIPDEGLASHWYYLTNWRTDGGTGYATAEWEFANLVVRQITADEAADAIPTPAR